jgi:uncharacterized protein YjlB
VIHQLKEGDVIVIPAGTPHWFSKIDGSIVYLVIRIDPSQLITLRATSRFFAVSRQRMNAPLRALPKRWRG